MGKGAGAAGKKRARGVKCTAPGKGDGYFSGAHQPQATARGRREAAQGLRKGGLVLELDGHFLEVPLRQRLRFQSSCQGLRCALAAERYERYKGARSLKDALAAGAVPDDLYYDVKRGLLAFVPKLAARPAPGPLPVSQWPPGVRQGVPRPWWLPEDWACGVKTTCKTRLKAFIAPNARIYYHRQTIEKILQQQLGGLDGMVDWARAQISQGRDWAGRPVRCEPDKKLFACLSKQERACLPPLEDLHFCVVSARRATERTGIRGIVNVQSQLVAAGASPRWYVDAESVGDYRRLGLDAVAGGRLTPSRNRALAQAAKLGKACVQISDDISRWEYLKGDLHALKSLGASDALQQANQAVKNKDTIVISPVAAARFLLAKLRAAEGRPRLGGVFPTGNAAFCLLSEAVSTTGFILGDFFISDLSPCRFDESMTLKEDYDFTCSHLARHGCVLRCNRLLINVAHETNSGGAVSVRDSKGVKERANIAILMRKWPGVFRPHGTRGGEQVLMRWPGKAAAR